MEEFLVYTHKKRVLTLTAKQRELLIEMPDELVRATISVNKNTWGYTHTYITSDSDFLIPEATRITGQDFTGNNYELNFLIDPTKIPEGVSAGYIHFNNTLQNISVKVSIKKPEVQRTEPKNRHVNFMIKKGHEALAKHTLISVRIRCHLLITRNVRQRHWKHWSNTDRRITSIGWDCFI